MKAKAYSKLLNRLDWALKHMNHFNEQNDMWQFIIANYMKVKSYKMEDLKSDIEKFKTSKVDVWDRKFYGLTIHESISAVAVPTSERRQSIANLIEEHGLERLR